MVNTVNDVIFSWEEKRTCTAYDVAIWLLSAQLGGKGQENLEGLGRSNTDDGMSFLLVNFGAAMRSDHLYIYIIFLPH